MGTSNTVYNAFGNKIGVVESQSRDFYRTTLKGGLFGKRVSIEVKTYIPQHKNDLTFYFGKTKLVEYLELDDRVFLQVNSWQTKLTVKLLNQIAVMINVPFTAKIIGKRVHIAYHGQREAFKNGKDMLMLNLRNNTVTHYIAPAE